MKGVLTQFMPETFMANFMQQLNIGVNECGMASNTDEVAENWEIKQFHEGFLVSSPLHGVTFYVEAGENNGISEHDIQVLSTVICGFC